MTEVPNEKQTAWESLNEELTQYGTKTEGRPPGEDVPIDQNIREAVAGLNSLGIKTTASCGGHTDDSLGAPMLQGIFENEEENQIMRARVQELLEEFNTGRNEEYKLSFHKDVTSGYRIESDITGNVENKKEQLFYKLSKEDQESEKWVEHLEEEGRQQIIDWVGGAQAEFAAFSEFLKQKYFSEEGM